jgi:hypothetical protein
MSYNLVLESQSEISPDLIKGIKLILQAAGIQDLKIKKNSTQKTTAKKTKPKTTWENCGAPMRDVTPEEAKVIREFMENPELLSAQESAVFLQELKMSL